MNKRTWPLWLGAGVIGVIGAIGLYSQKAGRAADVTPPTPEKITLQTLQLGKVRWQEGRTVRDLEGRTVLAVAMYDPPRPDAPKTVVPALVLTDPGLIAKITAALLDPRANAGNNPAAPPAGDYPLTMRFIFDDNTGITIRYNINPRTLEYYGPGWQSRDLGHAVAMLFSPPAQPLIMPGYADPARPVPPLSPGLPPFRPLKSPDSR
jgi:hypothetical protein